MNKDTPLTLDALGPHRRAPGTTTVVETAPGPAVADPERSTLIENYHGLIRDKAIRYPNPYHFVRELGKGRQGVVFLALRQGARGCLTRHAVKLHDPGIYSSAERYWTDMGRLASQVSKLQPIHSDHLVTPETYDESRGVGYLQMAAIDGVDLQFLLEGTHLAIARSQSNDEEWDHFMRVLFRIEGGRFMLQPPLALYILRRVLLGLRVMHEAGFIHGDIKPSNIMIDRMGSVKMVDFGRAVVPGERISILLGSPLYMAPEAHRLEPAMLQSDIFGAGLVALEMLRGQALCDCSGLDDAQLLAYKLGLLGRLDSMLPAHIHANMPMVGTLRRFLAPDARERFADAREAEDSDDGLREVHLDMANLAPAMEYDRELHQYLEKVSDPLTGHLNPRLT